MHLASIDVIIVVLIIVVLVIIRSYFGSSALGHLLFSSSSALGHLLFSYLPRHADRPWQRTCGLAYRRPICEA